MREGVCLHCEHLAGGGLSHSHGIRPTPLFGPKPPPSFRQNGAGKNRKVKRLADAARDSRIPPGGTIIRNGLAPRMNAVSQRHIDSRQVGSKRHLISNNSKFDERQSGGARPVQEMMIPSSNGEP